MVLLKIISKTISLNKYSNICIKIIYLRKFLIESQRNIIFSLFFFQFSLNLHCKDFKKLATSMNYSVSRLKCSTGSKSVLNRVLNLIKNVVVILSMKCSEESRWSKKMCRWSVNHGIANVRWCVSELVVVYCHSNIWIVWWSVCWCLEFFFPILSVPTRAANTFNAIDWYGTKRKKTILNLFLFLFFVSGRHRLLCI